MRTGRQMGNMNISPLLLNRLVGKQFDCKSDCNPQRVAARTLLSFDSQTDSQQSNLLWTMADTAWQECLKLSAAMDATEYGWTRLIKLLIQSSGVTLQTDSQARPQSPTHHSIAGVGMPLA